MDKENILKYINNDFAANATLYSFQNLPIQIGNAIYLYGSNEITDIIAFIDASEQQDGSLGMIITPSHIFYQFDNAGSFQYQDISYLSLEKHRHDQKAKATIKTNSSLYHLEDTPINEELFIQFLSNITEIDIDMILSSYEKVAYYVPIVLNDIIHDEYEDVFLTDLHKRKIKDFFDELNIINQLDDENYQYELKSLCSHALDFFDELELDSDEIDILYKVQEEFDKQKEKDEQIFDNAKRYYDDMMNKYKQGDSSMLNQMQSMLKNLGVDMDDLKNKSPEEMDQYINDLCDRFHISRSQLDTLIKKFQN